MDSGAVITTDYRTLSDLVEFARLEQLSGDIEPWAETLAARADTAVLGEAAWNREQLLWGVSLYNTTDDLGSALTIMRASPSPRDWVMFDEEPRAITSRVFIGGERRNLRGGKILKRIDSYVIGLAGQSQHQWISEAISPDSRYNFERVMRYLQHVWGVGRLAAFEWAEFLAKTGGYRLETDDGALWESSGPRESLERIFNGGQPASDRLALVDWAYEAKDHLAKQGVALSWWDFETVICDFNVMRKGRYYPGKHLAMISEEIKGLPDGEQEIFDLAYRSVIPEGWRDLPPGVDKDLGRAYALTGKVTPARIEATR